MQKRQTQRANDVRKIGGVIPQRQRTLSVSAPAPVGGLNAADVASALPERDCLALWNMIPFQYGLRVRSGYRELLGSALSGDVRSVISFNGSEETQDRLFVTTQTGIYSIAVTTGVATLVYTFPVQDANSGFGVSTTFANWADQHFCAYADATNGYLLYMESRQAWVMVIDLPATTWTGATRYELGDTVDNGGLAYVCTTAGISAATGGPTGGGTGITDGTCVWDFAPSIDSGPSARSIRHIMTWKNRLWLVAEASTAGWYLDPGAFGGTLAPVYIGSQFRYGGELMGLYRWTMDGGQGIDDLLVAISRAGDVVIYAGTDPSSYLTFGLKGYWWLGPVPPGRRIASDFGGDLYILSLAGCVPLSKVVNGGLLRDPNLYATQKVANLFNILMTQRGTYEGWEIRIHPTDNLLVIRYPDMPGSEGGQLVMSLATKGWAQHNGLPMSCMDTWKGKLYFGTADGQVCVNDGYTDNGVAISWNLLSAFQNFGSAQQKKVELIRPRFITDGTEPTYLAEARYDYDLSPINTTPQTITGGPDAWDVGKWDEFVWDGSTPPISQKYEGAWGVGTAVAMVLRGTSISNVTLVAFDIMLQQGGLI